MMKFFYDSLETLQKVTFASKKDYINLSIWVLISVVVFGAFFVGVDTIFSGAYKTFYELMKSEPTIEQPINLDDINLEDIVIDETSNESVLNLDEKNGITTEELPALSEDDDTVIESEAVVE